MTIHIPNATGAGLTPDQAADIAAVDELVTKVAELETNQPAPVQPLSQADADDAASTTEGTLTGQVLQTAITTHTDALDTRIDALEVAPPFDPVDLTATDANDGASTTFGQVSGSLLRGAIEVVTDPLDVRIDALEAEPDTPVLTEAEATDGIDTNEGLVTGQLLRAVTDTHVRGVFMGVGATFATLPDSNPGRVQPLNGDIAFLSVTDGTNPRGFYQHNGTIYTLAFPVADAFDVTDLEAILGVQLTDSDLGAFNGSIIPDDSSIKDALQALEDEVESINGRVVGDAATFAALPAGLNGDFAILRADDVGTGTARVPQYPAGVYKTDGTTYTLSGRFDQASVTGDYIGSGATFATLPTTSPTKSAANGDWAALSADDVGTGTALAPQYPAGVYVFDGTGYSFAFALGDSVTTLTDVQAGDRTDITPGMISGAQVAAAIEAQVRGVFMGVSATYAGLPIVNDGRDVLPGDVAILSADEVGTGTAANPQWGKGLYAWTGTAYAMRQPLASNQAGVFLGQSDTFAGLPTTGADGRACAIGDWALLTEPDGTNQRGIYQWTGGTFTLVAPMASVGGVYLGGSNTFANLPTTPNGRDILAGDLAFLTAADGANPRGFYTWNGTAFVLNLAVPAAVFAGSYLGSAATFATLPAQLGAQPRVTGDWAFLTANDGINLRGIYRWDGTSYVLDIGIPLRPTGLYAGSAATYATLPATEQGNWAILTADSIGAGTTDSPQFPRGIYTRGATAYALTLATPLQDDGGMYLGTSTTFANLPLNNGSHIAVAGDWAYLRANDGTNVRGVYRYDGSNFTLSYADAVPPITAFAPRAAVNAADFTAPTNAEILAWANAQTSPIRDAHISYNEAATRTFQPATRVWFIDSAGNVDRIYPTDIPTVDLSGLLAYPTALNITTAINSPHPVGGTMGEYVSDREGAAIIISFGTTTTASQLKTEMGSPTNRLLKRKAGTADVIVADTELIGEGTYLFWRQGTDFIIRTLDNDARSASRVWAANARFEANEPRWTVISGATAFLHNRAARQSGATRTAAEYDQMDYIGQSLVPAWAAGTVYPAGFKIIAPDGSEATRLTAGTAGGAFDATERAAWRISTPVIPQTAPAWTAGEVLRANDLRTRTISGVTGIMRNNAGARVAPATFDFTEAGNWTLLGQDATAGWSANTVYPRGWKIWDSNRVLSAFDVLITPGALVQANMLNDWSIESWTLIPQRVWYHTGTPPAAPNNIAPEAIAINTTTNRISHRWTGTAWQALNTPLLQVLTGTTTAGAGNGVGTATAVTYTIPAGMQLHSYEVTVCDTANAATGSWLKENFNPTGESAFRFRSARRAGTNTIDIFTAPDANVASVLNGRPFRVALTFFPV